MFMTQVDLETLLARNPKLRVRGMPKRSRDLPVGLFPSTADNRSAKYWNIKVYVQEKGVSVGSPDESLGQVLEKYDSIKEYQRNNELLLLLKAGKIRDLRRQVPITAQEAFTYGDEKIGPIIYKADFVYVNEDGTTVVEDVKGFDESKNKFRTTKDFEIKWKLMKFRYSDWKFTLV